MKYLLITGANGGIGSSICQFFKKKGWFIIGTDLHKGKKNDYIDKYYKVDLINELDIINMMSEISSINCLIHCAAYQCCKPVWEYTIDEWDNTYNCNVRSIFLLIKYGIEILKKSRANIINISSVHSIVTSKYISAYASTKAALVGLTKNLSIDLSVFGIRVNSISPGAINTKMLTEHLSEEQKSFLINKHLLKKIGEPKQISSACWFINNNSFINGSNMVIDGGVSGCLYTE